MPVANVPEVMHLLKREKMTVQNLLIENGQLIETVAEYQRMGRIVEATKYQERLHQNLIYLAKLADSSCSSRLLLEIGGVASQTNESPPPAESPFPAVAPSITPQNAAVVTLANVTLPYQQQCPAAAPVNTANQTSPNGQQHGTATTSPAPHGAQYQFPSPTQPTSHAQTTQQQPQTNANHFPQQTPAVPFQRNLNVPSHSVLFQHQNMQQSQQQMSTQHPIVYTGGNAMPSQHQQYSAFPLLQQQQPQQFPPIQPQFPPSSGAAYAPMVIPLASDPMPMGIRHQQTYQHSHSHSVLQSGPSPGGYMSQQK